MTSALDPFRMGRFLGFDPMFDQLDRFLETATSKVTWPPYNLAKLTEHMYQLQFALAGFSKDEIRVRQEGDYLIVEGTLTEQPTGPHALGSFDHPLGYRVDLEASRLDEPEATVVMRADP